MSFKKGYIINDKYEIKHLIDSYTFCETYSAKNLQDSKLVNISIYNDSKISRDDLANDGNLKEISYLKLGIPGLPPLIYYG